MMRLFIFEWKKLLNLKIYFYFLLITILFISCLFIYNVISQDKIANKKAEHFSAIASGIFSQNMADIAYLETYDDDEIEQRLEVGSELYTLLRKHIQIIQTEDWENELLNENNLYEIAKEFKNVKGNFPISSSEIEYEMNYNSELLKQNLAKQDMELSIQTSIFMKYIITHFLQLFSFLLLFFVLCLNVTKEFDDYMIKLVYSLPISRINYVLIKFVSIYFYSFLWLCVVFLVSYLLPTFFGKNEGDIFTYPIPLTSNVFMSTGTYLIQAIIYSFTFILFISALIIFLGFYIRNTLITYITSLLLILSNFYLIVNNTKPFFNPFTYGEINTTILTVSYFPYGTIIIASSAIVLLLAAILLTKRRCR